MLREVGWNEKFGGFMEGNVWKGSVGRALKGLMCMRERDGNCRVGVGVGKEQSEGHDRGSVRRE